MNARDLLAPEALAVLDHCEDPHYDAVSLNAPKRKANGAWVRAGRPLLSPKARAVMEAVEKHAALCMACSRESTGPCHDSYYGGVCADAGEAWDDIRRAYEGKEVPDGRCCGAIGCPGGITLYCGHASYLAGQMTTTTRDGRVYLQTTDQGFKCALGRDTAWVARNGCGDFEKREGTP